MENAKRYKIRIAKIGDFRLVVKSGKAKKWRFNASTAEKQLKSENLKLSRVITIICGNCFKHHRTASIDIFRETGQIITVKLHAAGEMDGFDISFPTDEQKRAVERAKTIRDCGIAQRTVEQKLKQGEQLNPHLN